MLSTILRGTITRGLGQGLPVESLSLIHIFSHTRRHLYRSALEGVAYSIQQQLRLMESHEDVSIDQIFAVGGGVNNALWMQIVADVTGREINTPDVTVGASYGDAMMAAVGVRHPGFENFSCLAQHIKTGTVYKLSLIHI